MNFINQYILYIRDANVNVKKFFWVLIMVSLSRGIYVVLFNLYLRDLGYTEVFVGQTISIQALAAVIILLPAGLLSDRWGRRRLMGISSCLKACSILLIALTKNNLILLILVFGIGSSQALFQVTNAPFLSENTHPRERLHLFSVSWSLMMFATMLGNILGGLTSDGLAVFLPTIASKQITLFIAGLVCLVALWPLSYIKETIDADKHTWKKLFSNIRGSGEMGTIGRFVFAHLLLGLGAGLFVPYFNIYFATVFGLSLGVVGTILALGQASMATAALIGPAVAQHTGRVKAICFFQLASVVFLLVLGHTAFLFLAVLSFVLRGGFMNAANPITTNLMMDNVSDRMKGTANSLQQLVFQLGWVICGPISGYLIATYSYNLVFKVAAGFYFFSTIFFYMVFRNLETGIKREAAY